MTNKFKKTFALLACIISIWSIGSCTKDDDEIEVVESSTDKELYEMAKSTTGFVWYKNSNSLLAKSSGSGHADPFLRTRYNSVAASKLTSTGQIIAGATFPEGSLIVKELHNTALKQYAILYKNSASSDADSKGWVWGYINADGSVLEPASKKGVSCISCHSQADNIDYMLMNKYFP